jgi:hypothetical protein
MAAYFHPRSKQRKEKVMRDTPKNISLRVIKHNLVQGPDLLFENFFYQARGHLQRIKEAQGSLQNARAMFNGIEGVWQCHCDAALHALRKLQEPVQAFCDLVRRGGFPTAICLQSYQLIVGLYHINEQGHVLTNLLTSYHPLLPLKHAFRQREEIYFGFKKLVHSSDAFFQKAVHLLDEAQFLIRENDIFHDRGSEENFSREDSSNSRSHASASYDHAVLLHRKNIIWSVTSRSAMHACFRERKIWVRSVTKQDATVRLFAQQNIFPLPFHVKSQ